MRLARIVKCHTVADNIKTKIITYAHSCVHTHKQGGGILTNKTTKQVDENQKREGGRKKKRPKR